MERHGSESYFVIGEGLLGEARGGRQLAAVSAFASVPPFRFSRMGPKGTGKQLGKPNRVKIAQAMTVDNTSAGQIPAGYTYLGQFLDHDLTFDKSSLMEGVDISPATLLQSRSPSLDLDSLYGAGPQDPGSAKFYESDGIHLKMGKAQGGPAGLRPAAKDVGRGRRGDHPRSAERREPRGRADPRRVHPVPQPRRRHPACLGAAGAALHGSAQDRHEALPVDDADRLPAEDLRARRRHERVQPGPQGVRGRRDPDQRPDDADRVLGRGLPARPQHGPAAQYSWNKVFPNATLGQLFEFSHLSGGLGGGPISRASGSPTSGGSTTSARPRRPDLRSSSRPRSSTARCGSTPSSSTRSGRCPFPTPAAENNLAFRNLLRANMVKLATGQQMVTFLKSKGVTLTKLTKAQIRDGNNGAELDGARRQPSETRSSRTRRCGSTSCARPSSTTAS